MDFTKAVNIIGRDLEEAHTLLEQLSSIPGSHVAEIELAKARIHTAEELLRLLPGLTGAPATPTVDDIKDDSIVKEVEDLTGKTLIAGKTTESAPVKQENQEATVPAPGPEAVSATEAPAAPVAQPQAKPKEAAKAILADRFGATGTLGEKISSPKKDEAITSVMQNKPIADIAAAIGINDKFYYIRELFSGDTTAYNDTVSRLNSAASLGEAMKILDESTVMGSDPAAQSSFVDVVRRKFSLNV